MKAKTNNKDGIITLKLRAKYLKLAPLLTASPLVINKASKRHTALKVIEPIRPMAALLVTMVLTVVVTVVIIYWPFDINIA